MKRLFAAMLLLLPAPAFAQAYSVPSGTINPCASPAPYVEVNPLMMFIVNADGTVRDVVLTRSTGNADVDAAALACAQRAHFTPATRSGTPVSAPLSAVVPWLPDRDMQTPRGIMPCPEPTPDAGPYGATVRYFVETDGRVTMLAGSSGNPIADGYIRRCIASWHLTPGLYKGEPVRVTAEFQLRNVTTAITQVTTTHEAPRPAITSPVATDAPHVCAKYPAEARRLHHGGVTVLHFTINTDGSVSGVTVGQSSGFDDLDQAAVECATHWIYKPAMQSGQPVAVPWRSNVHWTPPADQPEKHQ